MNKEERFTFSYGQCLYCLIGLVQIKTSVLREEETGSIQNIHKHAVFPVNTMPIYTVGEAVNLLH